MKGKNDSTPFLPLRSKTGGKVMYVQNKEDIYQINDFSLEANIY